MTVVVGIRGTKGVLLAADSQFSTTMSNRKAADPKTFQLSELVAAAYCGSGRLGQILTYHMNELEDPPLGMDEHYWAVKHFVTHLRDVLDNLGHLHVHRNIEHLGSSAFLLAVRGRLFAVAEDFDVLEHRLPFDAIGSGEDVAIGAMAALLPDVREPIAEGRCERVVRAGVEAASEFTNYVGGEIIFSHTIIYTDDEKALARQVLGK